MRAVIAAVAMSMTMLCAAPAIAQPKEVDDSYKRPKPRPTPAPTAKPPPAASACDTRWRNAGSANSIDAYEGFINACPGHRNAEVARLRASQIRCDARAKPSVAAGTTDALQSFVNACPGHLDAPVARSILSCNQTYTDAKRGATLDGLTSYLKACPNHRLNSDAQRDIEQIRATPFAIAGLPAFGTAIPRNGLSAENQTRAGDCERGIAGSCSNLGYRFDVGDGAPKDATWASTLYNWACAKDDGYGCSNVANQLWNGYGVSRDYARASIMSQRGCEKGNSRGCQIWGLAFENGLGADRNPTIAAQLYERSCKEGKQGGDFWGCTSGARLYDRGSGTLARDPAKALSLAKAGLLLDPNNAELIGLRDRLSGSAQCMPGPYIVFFNWGDPALTPEAASLLANAARAYKDCGNAKVRLAGHTDRSGEADYNIGLSQRQNSAVRSYLVNSGIPDSRISTEAFGEYSPRIATADGVREYQNRRVEITFAPE